MSADHAFDLTTGNLIPLTAAQARALLPVVEIDAVLIKITKKIAESARAGKLSLDVQDLFPKTNGWDHARAANLRSDIIEALKGLGYTVKPFSGGHGGSATIIVDWAG